MSGYIMLDVDLVTLNPYIDAERANKFFASSIKKKMTNAVKSIAMSNRFILEPNLYDVDFTWYCPNNRIDHDNIAFCKKFILDGLKEAGSIPDDSPKYVNNFTDTFVKSDKKYVHCAVMFNKVKNDKTK